MTRAISALLLALAVVPAVSEAGSFCRYKRQDELSKAVGRLLPDDCSKVNTRVTLDGNPFVYQNPDASCDLGFSFPGLPAFGLDINGLDSCKILRSVTDDLVNDINADMQNSLNDAVDGATDGQTDFNFDLNDTVTTGTGGGGGGNKTGGPASGGRQPTVPTAGGVRNPAGRASGGKK